MTSESTVVYRLSGRDRQLLYVGVAHNPGLRFAHHHQNKSWWPDVVIVTLTHYSSRSEALSAERTAIREERPRYNVIHNTEKRSRRQRTALSPVCTADLVLMSGQDIRFDASDPGSIRNARAEARRLTGWSL